MCEEEKDWKQHKFPVNKTSKEMQEYHKAELILYEGLLQIRWMNTEADQYEFSDVCRSKSNDCFIERFNSETGKFQWYLPKGNVKEWREV